MDNIKFFGRWSDYGGMCKDWLERRWNSDASQYEAVILPAGFPTDDEILFASYGGGSYEGDAFVLYRKDGKLYEVSGSHCSCYGLEGQWGPEETYIAALAQKCKKEGCSSCYFLSDHDGDAYVAYWNIVDELQRGQAS